MKKHPLAITLAVVISICAACTNMSRTEQGALSGGAIGAAAGAGIAAISRGPVGLGVVLGGALGAVAGGMYGQEQERKHQQKKHAPPPPAPAYQ
jgi:phage tail tape-measure protein